VELNTTVSPEEEVACTGNGAAVAVRAGRAAKVMVCGFLVTVILRETVVAALWVASPACAAAIVQVPMVRGVTLPALTLHTVAVWLLNDTGRPELALAVIVKPPAARVVVADGSVKVMLWVMALMTMFLVTVGAAA